MLDYPEGPQCSHMNPYKEETKGDLTHTEKEGHVKTE